MVSAGCSPKTQGPTREKLGPTREELELSCRDAWARVQSSKHREQILRDADAAMRSTLWSQAFQPLVDEMVARMAQDFAQLPKQAGPRSLTVEPVTNGFTFTPTAPITTDMLVNALQKTPAISGAFTIMTHTPLQGQVALNQVGADAGHVNVADPLTDTTDNRVRSYPAETVYRLETRYYPESTPSGATVVLCLSGNIWHPQSRASLFSRIIRHEYSFHPYRMEWVATGDERSGENSSR
jgi:hypothetical protein